MDAAQPSPRMSVIVRTKDRPELLAEALASLRAQSFRDFETVLVNDGAPLPGGLLDPAPGCGVVVVAPPAPGGRTRALNAGLAAARGGWVAYLDDDDVHLPDHLATLDAARRQGARAAHTSVRQVRQEKDDAGTWRDTAEVSVYDRPADAGRLVFKNDVPLIGLGHERGLAEEAGGFDESFDLFEDWDFLIRLASLVPIAHVAKVTAVYRVHAGTSVTDVVPWGSPDSDAARRRLYAKHAARMEPRRALAFVDAAIEEAEAVRGRERFLLGELGALRNAFDGERAQRTTVEAELETARAEAERFREKSATREQALAVQNAALASDLKQKEETLERIFRSRTWRLLSPWWKLKERLKS